MKLPKGIAVIIIYQEGDSLRKTGKMTDYETILNGYRMLNYSKRKSLIYPVNNDKKVGLTAATITLAYKEAMSLNEFKEYIHD